MASAPRVKIPRNDRLPFVGRYGGDGQFVASVVLAGAPAQRAWYAVLHTFDADGVHRSSDVFAGGPESDPGARRRADQQHQEWLRRLATMLLGPIEVAPFATSSHGVRFGVVEQDGAYRLEPDGLQLS